MSSSKKRFLPHPLIIIFIVLPVVVFITYFIFQDKVNHFFQNFNDEEEKIIDKQKQKEKNSSEVDTDRDGLPDWEEKQIYKTNPKSYDTDGDGFSDGQEVKNKTNPLDPFNKGVSEIKQESSDNNNSSYKNDKTLTKTDVVARDLFLKLTELRLSNKKADKETLAKLVSELVQENKIIVSQTYTISDLNISNILSVKAFKKTFFGLLKKYDFSHFQDEAILFAKFLKTNDDENLRIIQQQIGSYQKFERDLRKLPVPKEASVLYLEYINSFSLFIQIISSFTEFKDDPVLVSSMLSVYNDVEDRMSNSAKAFYSFLELK